MDLIMKFSLFLACALPMVSFAADECKTHRNTFVDNSDYKIWTTVICPRQPVSKHTHENPRVLIPQDHGVLRVMYADKALGKDNPRDYKLEKGKPVYLDYNQGKGWHTDETLGDNPLTVLVIELKNAK
ncbi:hypothetical protein [Serratia odorifera]|uniref:hypothetical protein n=1 Tax=Serratia odorifera TaxID=618 RepID=UPI0018E80F5E|nr:hypothetical protein [Serratia odorifera]MBJ2068135.1 hypothetical protein [Serratia odorifera]